MIAILIDEKGFTKTMEISHFQPTIRILPNTRIHAYPADEILGEKILSIDDPFIFQWRDRETTPRGVEIIYYYQDAKE